MRTLELGRPGRPLKTALFLGAHCDDIEIGCGGTVLRLVRENPGVAVHWVVFSSGGVRESEARAAAARLLAGCTSPEIVVRNFRNGFFPYVATEIKEFFEQLKGQVDPDVIFTQYGDDRHQDHRVLSELAWNTFRDHLILEYEIPKYDGGLGSPNVFVPLAPEDRDEKVACVLESFPSQSDKPWFTADTFLGLMRLRGIECNAPDGSAEAFYARKIVLGAG